MTDPERRTQWAAWLRARMAERGVSVRDVAEACGVTVSTAQGWRDGSFPTLDHAEDLTRVLRVTPAALMRAAAGRVS